MGGLKAQARHTQQPTYFGDAVGDGVTVAAGVSPSLLVGVAEGDAPGEGVALALNVGRRGRGVCVGVWVGVDVGGDVGASVAVGATVGVGTGVVGVACTVVAMGIICSKVVVAVGVTFPKTPRKRPLMLNTTTPTAPSAINAINAPMPSQTTLTPPFRGGGAADWAKVALA